ncbi:MAG: helix-turn-helix transcriptional regulator, partial [Nitrospinae bacterium]|nr:helix-turn-helix transcriptional regulator [Nitrospinota bacterium]
MEFAELIGVSHASVRRYEEGALPDIDVLMRIADVAKLDLGRRLTGHPLPGDARDSRPLHFHLHPARSVGRGFKEQAAFPLEPEGESYISGPLTEGKIAAGEP